MAKQFTESIEKKYIAVVKGILKEDNGIIDLPIGKEKDGVKNIVIDTGKKSTTEYKVVERLKNSTIVELKIITGRTHQIRVHLSHINHPVIGDVLYGGDSELIDRQALHSYYLKFKTPRKHEEIQLVAELPQDMKELVNNLK